MLGTGILVLPGLAAAAAGPASILAVAAVLVLSIPLAGTFAALASRYPDPGGVASYVRRTLGDTAARMTGYWFFFGVCIGAPVLAVLGGEYVVAVLGVDRAAVPIIALAIFVPPFVANWFGVRVAGWAQFVLTGLLITTVVGVVAVTFPAVEASNFQPFLPNGWGGVGTAISLFVWAFAGWEVGTHIAGEFKNPRRIIPLATAIAIVVVGAGYLALQVVTVGVLGDRAGAGVVPLLDLVDTTVPGIGSTLVAIVTAIVCLGVMNAYLPAFAKLGAALGRDGDLPRYFAKGAAAGEVPRRALMLTAVLVAVYFVLMLLNGMNLSAFILIHTSNMVAIYAAGMLAATLLLRRWSFGWWLAVVATVMTVGLLVLAWANLHRAAGARAWRRCSSPSCAACAGARGRRVAAGPPRRAAAGAVPRVAAASMASDLRTASETPYRRPVDRVPRPLRRRDRLRQRGRAARRGVPPRPAVAPTSPRRRSASCSCGTSASRSSVASPCRTSRSSRRRTAGRAASAMRRRMPRRHPPGPAPRRARGELVDLSHPIRAGLVTYPGIPAPTITPHLTREASREHYAPGTEFAIDLITMAGNTGTYLDSPFHRYAEGGDLASLDLATLVGVPAEVFRLTDAASRGIPAEVFLDRDLAGTAVLLHTGWSRHFGTPEYAHGLAVPHGGGCAAPRRRRRRHRGHRRAEHRRHRVGRRASGALHPARGRRARGRAPHRARAGAGARCAVHGGPAAGRGIRHVPGAGVRRAAASR